MKILKIVTSFQETGFLHGARRGHRLRVAHFALEIFDAARFLTDRQVIENLPIFTPTIMVVHSLIFRGEARVYILTLRRLLTVFP